MKILGIHDGHTATACLLLDGAVAGMVSEERFNRKKSFGGVPLESAKWLLSAHGLAAGDLDAVAVVGRIAPIADIGAYKRDRHRLFSALSTLVPSSVLASRVLAQAYLAWKARERRAMHGWEPLLSLLGRTPAELTFVDHHRAHACSAYFASGFSGDAGKTLVVTCDGSGDGLCATVSVGQGKRLDTIAEVNSYHSIGILYSRVTQLLGMKPLEHEYKVMGLAPYADGRGTEAAYALLSRWFQLSADGLAFRNRSGAWGDALLKKLHRALFTVRFDAVAAAVQRLHEELMVRFVLAWVQKTGIRRLALGGGSFMNVKCNMLLANRPEIDDVFVLPSCGDESTALGAAYEAALHARSARGRDGGFPALGPIYFGHAMSDEEIRTALDTHRDRVESRRVEDIEAETARLIAAGHIVGRMRGRMEWGARALGNRSIVASAASLNTVRKINAAIKMRDFWMPFAPSLLWERRDDYLVNPRGRDAPYMILAFESTELARRELIAGLHPFDLTCRPQLVRADWNPLYHRLISEYQALTGVGGILNTSFNLHGDPIAMTAADGIYTLLHSELDYLTLEDYLVWKRPQVPLA